MLQVPQPGRETAFSQRMRSTRYNYLLRWCTFSGYWVPNHTKVDELVPAQEGFLDTSFQGDPEGALGYL